MFMNMCINMNEILSVEFIIRSQMGLLQYFDLFEKRFEQIWSTWNSSSRLKGVTQVFFIKKKI